MQNLIQCSDNFSATFDSLCQYYGDKTFFDNIPLAPATANSQSFKSKN